MDQTPEQRARLLFAGAIGFYEAARSLYQMTGELHFPAFIVSLAFAAELSVKGFVKHKAPETTEQYLKDKIGHRLVVGYNCAVTAGYLPPSDVTLELFAILDRHHQNHEARYLSGNTVEMKPFHIMLQAMAHHLTVIGEQMGHQVQLIVPARP